jgi:hypothetical protein
MEQTVADEGVYSSCGVNHDDSNPNIISVIKPYIPGCVIRHTVDATIRPLPKMKKELLHTHRYIHSVNI